MNGAPLTQTERGRRLDALRAALTALQLDGLIIPRGDAFLSEYPPPSAGRLEWLCGFDGSAGCAVVSPDVAALFTDGRYMLQAAAQIDGARWRLHNSGDLAVVDWLKEQARPGLRLGYLPWLHSAREIDGWRKALVDRGVILTPLTDHPVDALWRDRPPEPAAPLVPHPLSYAGESSADKRARMGREIAALGASAAVVLAPDAAMWLFNLRGGDIPHAPIGLALALLRADGSAEIYCRPEQVGPETRAHLGPDVTVRPTADFTTALSAFAGTKVIAQRAGAQAAVIEALEAAGAILVDEPDPCMLAKAIKNPVELAGVRAAHRRDGAALCRFLAWLETEAVAGAVGEIAAAERLEAFRRDDPLYRGPSFDTISGAGPNGAIIHYRATPQTERKLTPGELYLLDSGGQYPDGTTDVTRTLLIRGGAAATDAMRDRYTRVLQGHIAVARAVFPVKTCGHQLDGFARAALWAAGLDFDHGVGHGVGAYLSVHEGPQRIGKVAGDRPTALVPGMILSNEPGYYRAGAYGIRIENLLAVRATTIPEAEREMLGFETLTLAPIDREMIAVAALTAAERAWVDAYHARVRREVGPLVDPATRAWLDQACAPLARVSE